MADETAARLVRAKGAQVQAEVTQVQVVVTQVQAEVTQVQAEVTQVQVEMTQVQVVVTRAQVVVTRAQVVVTYQAHYRSPYANPQDRARSELGGIRLNYRRVPTPPPLRRKVHPPAIAPLW